MHAKEYFGWKKRVVDADNFIPLILAGVAFGMIAYTVGELLHWEWVHLFHSKVAHVVANEFIMWIFFAYLGLELFIREIIQAGKFAGCATFGGMVIPPLITAGLMYLLLGEINWYIAVGAAATDVAFSLGAAKLITKGKPSILALLVTSLLILAVGDDLGGIGIAAGLYAENISEFWLAVEVFVFAFTFFCGERGVIDFKLQQKDKPETLKHWQWVVEIQSVAFWVFLGFLNTFVLWRAGVHWILGGCFAFIMAPAMVKEQLLYFIKPFVPLVLIVFGAVNGAINILDPKSWGLMTLATFIGGMYGKQGGIFAFGMLGRSWSKKSGSIYGKIPIGQVYGLSLFGSANGTVAIFFVASALANGFCSNEYASQAILGYFLTVPAVYVQTLIAKWLGIIKDDPAFQEEVDTSETLTHDAEQELQPV